jgi:hypothetical protein
MTKLASIYTNKRTITVRFFVVGAEEPELERILSALRKVVK